MRYLQMFESFDGEDVDSIKELLFSITDCVFENKYIRYDPNEYFRYLIDRREADVLFFWTFEFEKEEKSLLYGLYKYQSTMKDIYGYSLHRISFSDSFVLITMTKIESRETRLDVSRFFVYDTFLQNNDVLEMVKKLYDRGNKKIFTNWQKRVYAMSSEFWSYVLGSGIDYKNGDSSNLSLFDWIYKDYQFK